MFKKFTNGCVRVVNRWLPDPFLFAVILSIIVYVFAMIATKMGAAEGAQCLGAPPAASGACWPSPCRWLCAGVRLRHGFRQALQEGAAVRGRYVPQQHAGHRGHHLHFHHLLLAELGLRPDRRRSAGPRGCQAFPPWIILLLIASAYSGFVIWHAGLSGSIPLQLAEGCKLFAGTEQEMVLTASTADTIFHPMNIIMCCVILLVMPS